MVAARLIFITVASIVCLTLRLSIPHAQKIDLFIAITLPSFYPPLRTITPSSLSTAPFLNPTMSAVLTMSTCLASYVVTTCWLVITCPPCPSIKLPASYMTKATLRNSSIWPQSNVGRATSKHFNLITATFFLSPIQILMPMSSIPTPLRW